MADDAGVQKEGRNFWPAMIVIGLLAVGAFAVGSNDPDPVDAAEVEAEAIPVTADALSAAWRENEVAADLKFVGHPVRVTGPVAAIGLNDVKQPYVALGSDAYTVAVLPNETQAQVSKLTPGQSVTVLCTETLNMGNGLRLDDCALK